MILGEGSFGGGVSFGEGVWRMPEQHFNRRCLMKSAFCLALMVGVVAISNTCPADEGIPLSITRMPSGVQLSWPGTVQGADGSTIRPWFELQQSEDLKFWRPVGQRQRVKADTTQMLSASVECYQPRVFYRLLSVPSGTHGSLGLGGAEVLGYADALERELGRLGQITPEQFASMFACSASYLPGISWEATGAQFWQDFSADPAVVNEGKQWGEHGYRMIDTRLDERELEVFKRNGFVVSERISRPSFASIFYDLWYSRLPLFVSTDSLLQAWHRTYDAILEEMEETYLYESMQAMLNGMASELGTVSGQIGDGALRESLLDADFYLGVARSLLDGPGSPIRSRFGQDARVAQTLADIRSEQLKRVEDFMGFCRMVDFSQFKVRGHYTHSERLGRYFQCLIWLGRIDIPVAGGPWERCIGEVRLASPRELGLAIVLWHLLNVSGQFETWRNAEEIIQVFVGPTDSLTFGQLGGLLAGAGIREVADVPDLATLERIQADLLQGELGAQNICSDWFNQPLGGGARYALPRTFTVFGQKFIPDSWALSQTVYSSILWVENGRTNKVQRRVPGALDVAFAVLGNDQVVPELVAQMRGTFEDPDRPHARWFRDGRPYQHNLAAVRAVMERQTPDAWEGNIYMNWLACLRELSAPTTDADYPEAMRTRAWAMKTLNTQLASWAQLRHDTILYAKQSYTPGGSCVYPKGFVEPRLEFWDRFRRMAESAAGKIGALKLEGRYTYVADGWRIDPANGWPYYAGVQTNTVRLAEIQSRQVKHLQDFASTLARLRDLAAKELARESFTLEDETFLDGLMQPGHAAGYMGPFMYTGWYPQLFYRTVYWPEMDFHGIYGAGARNAIVADVHTDVPNLVGLDPDPGSVLHEGIGRVNLLMLAVDNGAERFVCAGPVLSHYEFEVIGEPRRLSDLEWGGENVEGEWISPGILDGTLPPDVPADRIEGLAPPVWTRSYLVH